MLYNLSVLELMGSADAFFIHKLVHMFIDSTIPELAELNEAHQNRDLVKIASVAHSMKSNIEIFSVDSMKQTIRILENKGTLPTLSDNILASHVEEVNTIIQNVMAEMLKDYPLNSD